MPDKVIVTKSKLDALATSIATKSGTSTPMTIAQMKTAVDNISGGSSSTLISKNITANGTYNASSDSADGYSSVTVDVDFPITATLNSQTGYWELNNTFAEITAAYNAGKTLAVSAFNSEDCPTLYGYSTGGSPYFWYSIIWWDYNSVISSEFFCYRDDYELNSNGLTLERQEITYQPVLQSKTNISPTESSQTITADSGFDGLSSVQINAISSSYVGSGIEQRDETDLTTSGATVTVPAGYYAEQETKSVASGTEGTPTVTKGTVSNYSVSVTPSVTNIAGYISGGTHSGTAVSVSASELVSGTYNVSSSGTKDVTNYASASVPSLTLPISASASATSGYTSKATISRSTSDQYINIPTGFNDAGGYYKISAVANGSASTPATSITANPSISVSSSGLITATASASQSVTPTVSEGYVSTGTEGTVTVSGSNTQQLTTQGATTYNTSTTDQTIASGAYLTGTQTIKAVTTSNLTAANVKAGTVVQVGDANDSDRIASVTGTFTSDANATATDIVSGQTAYVNGSKVTGTLVIQSYYTGSTAPSQSLGENGDIYLQS